MAVPVNMTLYRLLVKQGADEREAQEAATVDVSELATKADLLALRAELIDLKAELIKWNVGTLLAMTAIYGGLVVALKVFA